MSCSKRYATGPRLTALVLACLNLSCEAREPPARTANQTPSTIQLGLPPALREVSGLALTESGSVLAVADEQALVFEISLEQGTVEPWLAIGDPPLAGDFEGIERIGQRTWLVQSDGTLLWSDGNRYQQIATGFGRDCEIEGLALDPHSNRLLLLCKKHRDGTKRDQLRLRAVDAESGERDGSADLGFDLRALFDALELRRFNPSGVAFTADGSEIIIIAAKQRAFAVFDRAGTLRHAGELPKRGKHRQAEGITLLGDGRVAIADEGGKGAGKLSIYERIY
ncbi:MAG: hypothetical protein AAGG11_10840 [Pseudomonadota bacterium]